MLVNIFNNVIYVKFYGYYILQSGRTALHEAVLLESNDQVIKTLIQADASINIADKVS